MCGVLQGSILGPLLFLIFFNDFSYCLYFCEVVKFADDTVIYYPNCDFNIIEDRLNKDLQSIAEYFDRNDLIINLKKGKTESILFGTSKRLSKNLKSLKLFYNSFEIISTTSYKYLGVILDSNLSLNDDFSSKYKKASTRLGLLQRMRPMLTVKAAVFIYQSMIIPIITYCGILNLNISNSQNGKLDSLQTRASCIIDADSHLSLPSILGMIHKRSCILVRQCLDGDICYNFNSYFNLQNHSRNTRNNGLNVVLPVKLKYRQNVCFFYGCKNL